MFNLLKTVESLYGGKSEVSQEVAKSFQGDSKTIMSLEQQKKSRK